ncbi:hypothetical protein [Bdellovibrio sp. HCB337]|uniref:hypothetical protein n=1 Tax=Bdellovibrio sp. HCB337 TaxID=3394358 RepID=UPI0039A43E6B
MNSFRMRHLIMIPLITLAVVACAKRDSNFGKKSRGGNQTKTATDGTGTGTGTPTNPDDKVDLGGGDKDSVDQPEVTEETDEVAGYTEQCKNPILMDVADGDDPVTVDELLKDGKGTYSLIDTQYFVETETKAEEAKKQLYVLGSEYATPAGFSKAVSDSQKIFVNCHTIKPSASKDATNKIRHSNDLPNSFDAETGIGKVMRQDAFSIKDGTLKTLSTLYTGNYSLEDQLGQSKPEGRKVLIVKHGDKVIIKLKYSTTETSGQKTTMTASATYKLVKAEEAKETEEPSSEETKTRADR